MLIGREVTGLTLNNVYRDGGKIISHQIHHDDHALEKVHRLRSSQILDKAKLGLHENEDIRLAISCPSVVQWNRFKRENPDIATMLRSRDESERMKAARMILILQPTWVAQSRL